MKTLKNPLLFLLVCGTAFFMNSCEPSQESSLATEAKMATAEDATSSSEDKVVEPSTEKSPAQMLIKEAEIKFQVKDLAASMLRIEEAVKTVSYTHLTLPTILLV